MEKPKFQLDKKNITILTTLIFGMIVLLTLVLFDPGSLYHVEQPAPKKHSMPETSRNYGEKTDVSLPKEERRELPRRFETPFTVPDYSNFMDRIPTTIPQLTPPTRRIETPAPKVSSQALSVYAKHAEMLEKMRGGLNSGFKADRIADAPKSAEKKFNSSYVLLSKGESMERLDLMSLVKDDSMRSITTAKDALNALVEEANEVRIIEQKDDYLIYDIAGTRGYQVGRISVDDDGIHISGYVNLTTNKMPEFLKKDWIDKLRSL